MKKAKWTKGPGIITRSGPAQFIKERVLAVEEGTNVTKLMNETLRVMDINELVLEGLE